MISFNLFNRLGAKLNLCNFVNLWVVEGCIQDLHSVTCGICQIYFYDNLFNPNKNSKIQNKAKQKNNRNFT